MSSTLNDIHFSIISWEDASVEIEVLNQISLYDPHPTVLMMGKSMDTAITLAGISAFIHRIYVLCHNDFEEALLDLKINLLNTFSDPIVRMRFLSGTHSYDKMINMYMELEQNMTNKIKFYWNKNKHLIFNGLIHQDSWMRLFRLVKYDQSPDKIIRTFTYPTLLKIMDQCSTSYDSLGNSIKVPFSKYIRRVYENLVEDYDSPFSNLVINCQYDYQSYPRMFDSGTIDAYSLRAIRRSNGSVIRYILDYDEEYSMISLSNLTDVVTSVSDLEVLIMHIIKHLKANGRAIFRRRNTDIELYPIINSQMVIINHQFNQFIDHTHLYNELIIATPRSKK